MSSGLNPETKVRSTGTTRAGYSVFVLIIAFLGYGFSAMDSGLFGIALPTVAKSLHITGSQAEYILSIGMAISVIAGLFIGPFADRLGRRKMLQVVLLFTGVFSVLTAMVTNFIQLAIVRALDTIGLDNVGPANTLVSEEAPARFRGLFMGIMQAGYPVGMAMAGTIASFYLPSHWRNLFLIAFIPAFIVFLAAFWVREPKEFQLIRDAQKDSHQQHWSQLFKADVRKQTLILLFYTFLINSGIAAQAVYFTLYLTTHNHIGEAQAAGLMGITGWIAVLAQLLVGIIADRISAKYLLIVLPFIGAVGVFLMMGNGSYAAMFAAMTVYAIGGNGIYGCLIKYISESFPSRIRGTAITGLVAIGNIQFVLIPLLAGILTASGLAAVTLLLIGIMMVIAGFLMFAGNKIQPRQELHVVAGE